MNRKEITKFNAEQNIPDDILAHGIVSSYFSEIQAKKLLYFETFMNFLNLQKRLAQEQLKTFILT